MSNYIIRPAVFEDIAAIARVRCQSWRETYSGLIEQSVLDNLSPEKTQARMEGETKRLFIVAELDGEIVGFASYLPSRDSDASPTTGEVQAIYLLARCQHQGIGCALMEQSLQKLIEMGMTEATLWVLDSNMNAIRFYERCGFAADGSAKADPIGSSSITELRMRKPL